MQEAFFPPDTHPMTLFESWYEAYRGQPCPSTMDWPREAVCLATANAKGEPSARMVLLRGYDRQGFVFYTNYESHKARDLKENPNAALTFWWPLTHQQVRASGTVEPISAEASDAYFADRPRGSKIGAWASQQSATLATPENLARAVRETEARFPESSVPRPPHWGGYCLKPITMEFWMAGEHRLHHRRLFEKQKDHSWTSRWLYP